MEFRSIESFEELQADLVLHPHQYLLLYKGTSDNSNCAITNLSRAIDSKNEFLKADVSEVRDIHTAYNITTVPALLEFNDRKLKNVVKGCQTTGYYQTMLNENTFIGKSGGENKVLTKRVKVYSTPTCPWCTRVKEYLRSQNIRFTEVDVSKDQSAANRMVAKSGQRGVPQTEINGRMIVGFDKNKIDLLLDIK